MFSIASRSKDSEDGKREPGDAKEQLKTALGRRASGIPSKLSKSGEQVCNAGQSCCFTRWFLSDSVDVLGTYRAY